MLVTPEVKILLGVFLISGAMGFPAGDWFWAAMVAGALGGGLLMKGLSQFADETIQRSVTESRLERMRNEDPAG